MFQDWGAELLANAALYNAWVQQNPMLPAGHLVSASGERKVHPTLGFIDYRSRGCPIHRASAPHGLWHFDKAASHARALQGAAHSQFKALVQRTGGEEVMAIETDARTEARELRVGIRLTAGRTCRAVLIGRPKTATRRAHAALA